MLTKKINVLIALFAPFWILAQDGLPFEQYTVEDGLASNQIYWSAQDSKGDLWICSDHGLIAFDGLRMRSFTTENGLPENTIFKCFPDSKGRLWFTTQSNGVFWMRNDTIHIPKFNKNLIKKIGAKWLDKLFVDEHDSIWMSTFVTDSVFYKAKLGSEEVIPKSIFRGKLCKDLVYFVKKDGNCIFSGGIKSNVNFNSIECPKDTSFVKNKHQKEIVFKSVKNFGRTAIVDGKIKSSDSRYRVYYSNGVNGFEWFSIRNMLFHIDSKDQVQLVKKFPDQILNIFQDEDHLIVSAGDYGLVLYETNGQQLIQKGIYFKDLNVSHITKDRSGNYWISVINEGLFKISSFDVQAIGIEEKYVQLKNISKPWNFRNDSLLFLVKDSLFIFKRIGDNFRLLDIQNLNNSKDYRTPTRVVWDSDNSVFAQGWSWDFKRKKFKSHYHNLGAWAKWSTHGKDDHIVYDMSDGYIISNRGKTVYDSRKNNFKKRIRSFLYLDSSHYYLGGLQTFYEFKNGKHFDLGQKDERLRLRIEDIQKDKEGNLWLATRGSGLGVYNKDSLYFISKEHGLSSNLVNKVFILEKQIFVATNKGLDRITADSQGDMVVNTIFSQGIGSLAFIDNLFETEGGIIVQNGNNITFLGDKFLANSHFTPSVIFSQFSVAGRPKTLDGSEKYYLKPTENNIGFTFRINALQNESQPPLFQFRLLGLYSNWQSSFDNEIMFNGLDPGKYQFEIKVREANNNWSEVSSISFHISKSFYLKPWFIVTILLALLGLLFYYLRFRNLQVARSKELITSNIKALKNQMNPHFIFNSLNSIQYFIATDQKREANVFLAKLSDLVRNVLNTTNQSSISLDDELRRIEDYVQLEQMRLANSFVFRIENFQKLDTRKFSVPPMLVQPIIENAIWHGLADIEVGGEIVLKLHQINLDLTVEIEDNGHGMDIGFWEKDPTNSGKGNSIGLANVKQRMSLLAKIKNKEYSINFENIEENPRKGTRVQLKIPQ